MSMDINEFRDILDDMDKRQLKRFDKLYDKFDDFDQKFESKLDKNKEINERQHNDIEKGLARTREEFITHKAKVETRSALIAVGISMIISATFLVIAIIRISNNLPV